MSFFSCLARLEFVLFLLRDGIMVFIQATSVFSDLLERFFPFDNSVLSAAT